MATKAGKISWKTIGPLVLDWMLPVEITNMKNFRDLFDELTYENTLIIIWLLMQPKDSWLCDNIGQQVQAVYDCISSSPQLMLEHAKLLHIGSELLLRDQFTLIKERFIVFFHRENYSSVNTFNMITLMIQISPSGLIEELFRYYVDIYRTCVEQYGFNSELLPLLQIPEVPSFIEYSRMRNSVRENSSTSVSRMLAIHIRLENEVVNFREIVIEELVENVEQELTNLHQLLAEYPL